MFTRIFGTIIDPTETAEFAAKSAGMEYQAIQDSMEYRAGAIGELCRYRARYGPGETETAL
ncbi:hypothetical protein OVX87_31925 [Klebsiella pneumoniae]|nr:hypothetical protein [Klebsiella pneumoniae]MCY0629502.1 hypothetical protein [Klebsiella pneumoniae]